MDLPGYNRQFLEKVKLNEPIFNNSAAYGVKVKKLSDTSIPLGAKKYWRVVGVYHLNGAENMGNHHAYCEVLDEDGTTVNYGSAIINPDNVLESPMTITHTLDTPAVGQYVRVRRIPDDEITNEADYVLTVSEVLVFGVPSII